MWLHLAGVTGARRGELCGTRWYDVDAAGGRILIERAVVDAGTVKDTKTHVARRIALGVDAPQLLADHRVDLEKRAADGGTPPPTSSATS